MRLAARIFGKVWLWLLLLPMELAMGLLAFPAAVFLGFFPQFADRLPWRWFTTPDSPLEGDPGHRERWAGLPDWLLRILWLSRNRAYDFSETVLRADASITVHHRQWRTTLGDTPLYVEGETAWGEWPDWGPIPIGDQRGVEGLEFRWTEEGYWQLYWIKAWRSDRCIRVNLGWKLWGQNLFGQYVFAVNPWKSFTHREV